MTTRIRHAVLAGGAIVAALVLGQLSQDDAERRQDWLTSYCTDAAVWQAEEARGVPLNQRTGAPDYRGIAAESCPGMRPAGPALAADRQAPARFTVPETAGRPVQMVQF
ncbi:MULTISPECIES: hypothetical protein [unclassified Halomonas]|uniref:hypothetical protein n=1 Tax=unclassified Halomonas TaxID=2609666 RepID=UPI0020768A13|nr:MULTISPECIES: hypothetical protein [unclassified Halomonas]